MKLTTVTMPAVEFESAQEEDRMWRNYHKHKIAGKRILHWETSDGKNQLLLEGEKTYRLVIINHADQGWKACPLGVIR